MEFKLYGTIDNMVNKQLKDIPNRDGFKLRVRDVRGAWHDTTVIRNERGLYHLNLPPGVLWSDLVAWCER